ncbi:MAG TPA: transglutaminase domain-containing protein [Candidatus Binatia bacterium]|jgi:hypothetical protein|nr:transglutaminase domain-containing protein [Candidatus Binatia bacterium]
MKDSGMPSAKTALQYYTQVGPMTEAGKYTSTLRELPRDVAKLCEIIQGLLIHRHLAQQLYGVQFSPERVDETHIRPLAEMLERITALDERPLTASRTPEKRLVSVCRDYALMSCAILRYQGVAARARCGFGAYFDAGNFVDHWVCEYWSSAQSRWILLDAQIDAPQRQLFRPDFDPLDVPRDRFLIAGDAWQQCRSGRADASRFGILDMHGAWFIGGNVIRDLAALNRTEMLPWDVWGGMCRPDEALSAEQTAFFDQVAELTVGIEEAFPNACAAYDSDDRLRVPSVVFNAVRNVPETVSV